MNVSPAPDAWRFVRGVRERAVAAPVLAERDAALAIERDDRRSRAARGKQRITAAQRRGRAIGAPELPAESGELRGVGGDDVRSQHRRAVKVVRVDDARPRPALARGKMIEHVGAEQSAAVVADHFRVGPGGEPGSGIRHGRDDRRRIVGVVDVVESHEHLVLAHDAVLCDRVRRIRLHDRARIHARVVENAAQATAGLVVADDADHAHVGTHRREVDGRVRGTAGREPALRDLDDGRGRLAAHALGLAVPPAVENEIADHEDLGSGRRELGDKTRRERRRHDATSARPMCTTLSRVISSSSLGP